MHSVLATQKGIAPAVQQKPGQRTPISEHIFRAVHVAYGTGEWHSLGMDKRLEGVPHLASLIRDGRAAVVYHDEATSTVAQKSRASGMAAESVLRVLCCENTFDGDEKFLVAATGAGKIRLTGLLSAVAGHEFVQLRPAEKLPAGMAHGTCTPFASAEALAGIALIVMEPPHEGLKGREVDIALGGTDEVARHLAVRMRYGDLVDAMTAAHPGKVHVSEIPRSN
ncbi:MAG: hypothetical protein PHV13_03810 [Candidatus ainarchaeum sp.]|nr:hypothetical protein [Candidatus ainarchaeum sp.]